MDSRELNHPPPATQVDEDLGNTGAPTHGVIGHLSSDEELQQAVCAALLETRGLDARNIQVAVLGHGEVTLLGSVPTSHERALATRVARAYAPGRNVHADLTIRRETSTV